MKRKGRGKEPESGKRRLDFEENSGTSSNESSSPSRKQRQKANGTTKKRKKNSALSAAASFLGDDDDVPHSTVKEGEAEVGIIEKVTLKNFMCHSNLEFEFGPHVNFIIGRNGSGKSAILNGIMIALGSRASTTGRSQNIAGYVQTNKQAAFASVTIRNSGADAYMPNEYGSRIIVERKITTEGQSQYKLKAWNGKLVSLKREELINILDTLNIQVENPVSVLTQDASKCFLDAKDLKKKYEFFFKATQLEKLKEQYDEADLKRHQAHITLMNKITALPEAKQEVIRLEAKVKRITELEKQSGKMQQYENELAWTLAIDAEKKEEEAKVLVEKFKKEIESLQRKIKDCHEQAKNFNSDLEKLKIEDSSTKGEMDKFRSDRENVDKAIKDLAKEVDFIKVKIKSFERKIQTIQIEKQQIQNSLDELAQQSQEDLDTQRQQREELLLELEETGVELVNDRKKLEQEIDQLNQNYAERDNCLSEINQGISNLENQVRNKEYEQKTIKSSISNQEYQFGSNIPLLRQRIQQERHRFTREPIGPIGLFVKIADSRWSFAVEKCLSRTLLQSFCCDNIKDAQVLRGMMKDICGPRDNIQIITSEFMNQIYDVSQNKVRSNHRTVFDMVTSDNPIILNCLIDQKSIESILLVEDSSMAVNIMLHSPPANCFYTYTMMGDQIYPDPNYRYYSCKQKQNNCSLLQRFGPNDIRVVEEIIQDFKRKICDKVRERNQVKVSIQQINRQIDALKIQQSEVRRRIFDNDRRKKECQSATMNVVDVSSMHAELDNQTKGEMKYISELKHFQEEEKEKAAERQNEKKKLEEIDAAISRIKDKRKKILHDIERSEQQRANLLQEKANHEKRITRDKESLKSAKEEHEIKSGDLKIALEGANARCPRLETRRSVDVLQSKLHELKAALDEQNKNLDREQIIGDYVAKKKQLEVSQDEIQNLKDSITRLKTMLSARKKKFNDIRTLITLRVQYIFNENLAARSFSGQLAIDHNAGTLSLTANPNTTNKWKKTDVNPNRKTNTLSGGERSFVTVALLMALSDASEIPFHILDEYDVFMDNMNKEQSLKMMIEKANEQRNNQFIFLSPLDLPPSAYTNPNLIKIQRMPDPERGNVRPIEEMRD